ncbi:MAG: hypothetical protein JSW27_12050, partial [Phycisphaerales bacterium]
GDISGAEEALTILLHSADVRQEMGIKARQYYEAFFGRERSVSRLVEVLEAAGSGIECRWRDGPTEVAAAEARGWDKKGVRS